MGRGARGPGNKGRVSPFAGRGPGRRVTGAARYQVAKFATRTREGYQERICSPRLGGQDSYEEAGPGARGGTHFPSPGGRGNRGTRGPGTRAACSLPSAKRPSIPEDPGGQLPGEGSCFPRPRGHGSMEPGGRKPGDGFRHPWPGGRGTEGTGGGSRFSRTGGHGSKEPGGRCQEMDFATRGEAGEEPRVQGKQVALRGQQVKKPRIRKSKDSLGPGTRDTNSPSATTGPRQRGSPKPGATGRIPPLSGRRLGNEGTRRSVTLAFRGEEAIRVRGRGASELGSWKVITFPRKRAADRKNGVARYRVGVPLPQPGGQGIRGGKFPPREREVEEPRDPGARN